MSVIQPIINFLVWLFNVGVFLGFAAYAVKELFLTNDAPSAKKPQESNVVTKEQPKQQEAPKTPTITLTTPTTPRTLTTPRGEESSSDEEEDQQSVVQQLLPKLETDGNSLHRAHVLAEFRETEKNYVDSLTTLVEVFVAPIRQRNLLSTEIITKIFADIELIHRINIAFYNELEARIKNEADSEPQEILCNLFSGRAQTFKLYSSYVNKYPKICQIIHQQRDTNAKFAEFLTECRAKLHAANARSVDILSFMIMPIQRLPRYRMLLEDLLKHADPYNKEFYNKLKSATEMIQTIATYVNEKKREVEQLTRVVEIQEELGLKHLATPSRKFIKEAFMKKIRSKENRGTSSCTVYLFNDLLMCVKTSSKKQRFSTTPTSPVSPASPSESPRRRKSSSPLFPFMRHITEVPLHNDTTVTELNEADNPLYKNAIMIKSSNLQQQDEQPVTLKLACSSEEEKREWVEAIRQVIQQPRVSRSPSAGSTPSAVST